MKKRTLLIFSILSAVGAWLWLNYTLPMAKYNIPIEKIYVINLDRSKDRLDSISKGLKEQNLEFTRFPAVLGTALKIKDENGKVFLGEDLVSGKQSFRIGEKYKIYCPNVTINYEWNPSLVRGHGDPISAGELGVYCSNFEIMQEVIKHRYKAVLILEDDLIIPPDFTESLKILEKNMPNYKKYDAIALGSRGFSSNKWIHEKLLVKKIPFNSVVEKVTSYDKSNIVPYAVIVGFSGAKKILGINPKQDIGFDIGVLANRGEFNTFWARNINLKFKDFGSEIEKMGRKNIIPDPNKPC